MAIELIVMDVDGCLTDGRITYSEKGDELKSFDVKDGLAIASWIRMGRHAAIITGRSSTIVERRARELGIEHYYQGVRDKGAKLRELLSSLDLAPENLSVIGDDLNDYAMLKEAALAFTPADGVEWIRRHVDVVLNRPGGRGAVREMIEILLDREGLTEEFHRLWSVA